MKKMTDYQRELVAQNLDIVERTIKTRIKVNGQALQSYEDFYQIGCEALCRAAMDYKAEIGNFAPFGSRYVYNALIDHCRKQNNHTSHRHDHISDSDNDCYALDYFGQFVDFDDGLYLRDLNEAFSACKEQYSGIARRGIEAIELKSLGYTTREIADKYDTTVNNVNAWISRARSKLMDNPEIMRFAL